MLTWEYNIWNKTKLYLENHHLNLFNGIEYKEAYTYWLNRQLSLMPLEAFFIYNNYIIDFFADMDKLSREIYEDYLYITLNLILANTILKNSNLNLNLNNEKEFFDILESIIKIHCDKYADQYKCLSDLRIYSSNNCYDIQHLKNISDQLDKESE